MTTQTATAEYLTSIRAVLVREGASLTDGYGGPGSFGVMATRGIFKGSFVQLKPGMSLNVVRQVLAEV